MAYFLTICTLGRGCLFGDIVGGALRLNAAGQAVADVWADIPNHFPHVELDEFIIMPNHVHGIILIDDKVFTVGATHASPLQGPGPQRGSLGAIVGQFKSAATKHINKLRDTPGPPVWQRNYYERVLRNDDELTRARDYIANNPIQWDLDHDNPANYR